MGLCLVHINVHNPFAVLALIFVRVTGVIPLQKQSIINAYEAKTGMSRVKLAHMMDDETWMNAKKALELGFINKILFAEDEPEVETQSFIFGRMSVTNCLLNKFQIAKPVPPKQPTGTPVESLDKRLSLLSR